MPPDAEVINRLLNLLHEWGWEAGFRRLEEEIDTTADPNRPRPNRATPTGAAIRSAACGATAGPIA